MFKKRDIVTQSGKSEKAYININKSIIFNIDC